MTWIMVDVEADGPCPGLYSMIQVGAVVIERGTPRRFMAEFCPLEGATFDQGALDAIGITRLGTLTFPPAEDGMYGFEVWLRQFERPMFISDNNGFDWQFVNWYCWKFLGKNPFGHSSQNLGGVYKGCVRDMTKNFKHLRRTKHTHNPVDDAMGNVEALLTMVDRKMIRIPGIPPVNGQ